MVRRSSDRAFDRDVYVPRARPRMRARGARRGDGRTGTNPDRGRAFDPKRGGRVRPGRAGAASARGEREGRWLKGILCNDFDRH